MKFCNSNNSSLYRLNFAVQNQPNSLYKIPKNRLLLDIGQRTNQERNPKNMNNCINCQKKFIEKTIVSVMDIKSKEIEAVLHLSKSVVSRHMTGEKNNIDVDIYIIEKAFGIKIKDYSINE